MLRIDSAKAMAPLRSSESDAEHTTHFSTVVGLVHRGFVGPTVYLQGPHYKGHLTRATL